MNRVLIRLMTIDDLDAVIEIEKAAFSDPFNRELFEKYLSQESFQSWVAIKDDSIVGYSTFVRAADEIDLLNIAVKGSHRQQGIASQIMQKILEVARTKSVRAIFLEVRPSNLAAIKFYDRLGFQKVGVRRKYYRDNGEDALVYMKDM